MPDPAITSGPGLGCYNFVFFGVKYKLPTTQGTGKDTYKANNKREERERERETKGFKVYKAKEWEMGWAIVVHGDAGGIPLSLPPEKCLIHEASLHRWLDVRIAALKAYNHPLDFELLVFTFITIYTLLFIFIASLVLVYVK